MDFGGNVQTVVDSKRQFEGLGFCSRQTALGDHITSPLTPVAAVLEGYDHAQAQ